jgi:hypothetical protein
MNPGRMGSLQQVSYRGHSLVQRCTVLAAQDSFVHLLPKTRVLTGPWMLGGLDVGLSHPYSGKSAALQDERPWDAQTVPHNRYAYSQE